MNLSRAEVQEEVWTLLHAQKPLFVVGSPPCTSLLVLQSLLVDTGRERVALEEGIQHLAFCAKVYELQLLNKRHFIHEHPEGAWSWDLPPLKRLREREGVLNYKP
eukprot:1501967-Amphidinium_carterae.1